MADAQPLPPALLSDLQRALRGEYGARSFYPLLARRVSDPELATVLASFAEEQVQQAEALRALLQEVSGRAPRGSLRRALLAHALHLATFVGARAVALRLCLEAESTLARAYALFAQAFASGGRAALAARFEALAETKLRHARSLETWVER